MSQLAHVTWGQGSPLLLIHGFTGSREAWSHLRPLLGPHFGVIAPDLPGHGESPLEAETTFESTLDALLGLLDARRLERVDVVGYSLGARVALGLCLRAPDRVGRLILESGSPGLRRRRERLERRRDDAALAEVIEREGLEAFVRRWEALPLFEGLRALPDELRTRLHARRLSHRPDALAGSLRALSLGAQPSYWTRLWTVRAPTLLLTGERDAKFTGVARAMAAEIPLVWGHVFPGAGHAPHLESPEEYAREVTSFLSAPWIERPLVDGELGSNQA
ncbi:MAG TPA: 2-succinyl-6-hydroxy-2,4-cyclohexadiene-1-carboxylate synthase [Myxococcaceae bacterium]|nr:2-succinyl-6-hydroxy-2,4-cyclohexadiene-1-carboxylate synthase [Myxococcaceae bacterium]